MTFVILILQLTSSYFVEWIPNNIVSSTPSPNGEFPWQT